MCIRDSAQLVERCYLQRPDNEATAEQLLILLFETQRKPTRFQAFAKQYAGYAARNPIHQTSLFPGQVVTPKDGLERAMQWTQ